jgi:hypothetical protein
LCRPRLGIGGGLESPSTVATEPRAQSPPQGGLSHVRGQVRAVPATAPAGRLSGRLSGGSRRTWQWAHTNKLGTGQDESAGCKVVPASPANTRAGRGGVGI